MGPTTLRTTRSVVCRMVNCLIENRTTLVSRIMSFMISNCYIPSTIYVYVCNGPVV